MSPGPLRRRWPRPLLFGGGLTGLLVIVALLSLAWVPVPVGPIRIPLRLQPPLRAGLFGTDALGRDVLSLLMAGAWNSLSIAFAAVALGLAAGVALGTFAAAFRGLAAEVILRGADLIFAFPALISAIMLGALFGVGRLTAVIAIGVFAVPVFVRVSRSAALQVWARDYCLAARAAGKGRLLITLEHVVPNIAGPLAVQATIQLGLAVLIEAGLSFLGLGLPPPAPSWGRMLFEAQTYFGQAPWLAWLPGATIALAVLGFNLLGDGLRDLFDPRMSGR
jgi:peptide/nickel transport system permease protein